MPSLPKESRTLHLSRTHIDAWQRASCISLFTVWKGQRQPLPFLKPCSLHYSHLISTGHPSSLLRLTVELLPLLCVVSDPVFQLKVVHVLMYRTWRESEFQHYNCLLLAACTYSHYLCWPWHSFRYCQTWSQHFHPADIQTLKREILAFCYKATYEMLDHFLFSTGQTHLFCRCQYTSILNFSLLSSAGSFKERVLLYETQLQVSKDSKMKFYHVLNI